MYNLSLNPEDRRREIIYPHRYQKYISAKNPENTLKIVPKRSTIRKKLAKKSDIWKKDSGYLFIKKPLDEAVLLISFR